MNTNDEDLDNESLKLLRGKLPSILTTSAEHVTKLLRQSPAEAANVAEALEAVGVDPRGTKKEGRQWLGHSMASLPPENWIKEDGLYSVTPTRDASLRYLLQDVANGSKEGAAHLRSRKRLYDELSRHLVGIPGEFRPMLEWTRLYKNNAINCDIALARTIDQVEALYMVAYSRAEVHCRAVNNLTDKLDVPTPIQFIPRLAKQALSDTFSALEELVPGPTEELSRDHLVVRLMCDVAANRVLLESARLGALAKDAAGVTKELLEAMNSRGITKVPDVHSDADIARHLSGWFGKGGSVLDKDGLDRFLSGADLKTTVETAKQVQVQYLGTRGRPGLMLHESAHRTSNDTLMFALALVGVFEQCSKVENEFRGKGRYAVFPARGKARSRLLRPHAQEMAKTIYSQMAFANRGWGLLATHVQEYEQAMALKRSCLQMVIFQVFKRWPAGKLCALHQAVAGAAGDAHAGDDSASNSTPFQEEA